MSDRVGHDRSCSAPGVMWRFLPQRFRECVMALVLVFAAGEAACS
jgi:hypothetical protein